jgi:hypothetical protein
MSGRCVDLVASWSAKLTEATEYLKLKREEALSAEEELRVCVREAFNAGLTVTPISEATGLSTARIYQMVIWAAHPQDGHGCPAAS